MTINEFLEDNYYDQAFTNLMRKHGIKGLLDYWEIRMNSFLNVTHWCLDLEYENDLAYRSIIEDICANCDVEYEDIERLEQLDEIFKKNTVEITKGFWQAKEKTDKNWFLFRVPPERISKWYEEDSEEMQIWQNWKDKRALM